MSEMPRNSRHPQGSGHYPAAAGGQGQANSNEGAPRAEGAPDLSRGAVPMVSTVPKHAAKDRSQATMSAPGVERADWVDNRSHRPAPRRRSVLSTVLIIVGVVLLLVAGGMFGYAQLQYHDQDAVNEQLSAFATIPDVQTTADSTPQPPVVDWASLKAVNSDVVGWVQIPGTVVNYPVYQGDSNDTYLRTSAYGTYSIGGQIFMDFENTAPGLIDNQTLIYGHHLNNGAMFAAVDEMSNQATFDEVSTVWYVTERATYELEPLFFYRTPATNSDARRMNFATPDDFHSYLSKLLSGSSAKASSASGSISSVTKVLTLATCDYDTNFGEGNGRGLLVCALKEDVTASTAATTGTST